VNCNPREIVISRRENQWFQVSCDIAIDMHNAALIEAAKRRAVDGTPRYQLGGRERDQPIQVGVDVSDRLMELLLKRADPTFNEKSKVEVAADVNLAATFDYMSLSSRARAKLRELLVIIKEDNALAEKSESTDTSEHTGQEESEHE